MRLINARQILEVIVTNADEATSAQSAGADRLELIREFAVGGLTPHIDVVKDVLSAVTIPVRIMVREKENFSMKDPAELLVIQEFMSEVCNLSIDGLVLGFVTGGQIDESALKNILQNQKKIRITFHRAFEATIDPLTSIRLLKNYSQIDKILSNGGPASWGSATWSDRIERLEHWQKAATPIKMLVGGDIDAAALQELKKSDLTEFHLGRSVRTPETTSGRLDPEKISMMNEILKSH